MKGKFKSVLFAMVGVLLMVSAAFTPMALTLSESEFTLFGNNTVTNGSALVDDLTVTNARDRVVDAPSPISEEDFLLGWTFSTSKSSEDWNSIPSTGTVAGDYYYTRAGSAIYKLEISTGNIISSHPSTNANYMYGHYVDYANHGDGLVIDNPNTTVLDTNLNALYKIQDGAIRTVYHEGFLYTLSEVGLYKYSPDKGSLSPTDVKEPIWVAAGATGIKAPTLGQYPVFVGNYAYLTNTESKLIAVNLGTGEINETMFDFDGVNFNAEPTYWDNTIYVTTYTTGLFGSTGGVPGKIFAIPVNTKTGVFDLDNVKSLELVASNNNSSAIIYNGYGYVNTEKGFQVFDLTTFEEVANTDEGTKVSRGNMALTYHYATPENGNKVYLYVVPYDNYQQIIVYTHAVVDGEHQVERIEVENIGTVQFCTETVQFGPNGELIWHNDSSTIHCYVNASLMDPVDDGDINMDGNVDLADAIEIAKSLIGSAELNNLQKKLADYNGDAVVDMKDVLDLIKYITHAFPVDFSVEDNDGNILDSAIVRLYFDADMTVDVNDAKLFQGTYYYSIKCAGYGNATGSFEIENQSVIISVTMTELSLEDQFTVSDGYITGYSGPGGDVVIPDEIAGESIMGVAELVFKDRSDIVSVTIPDGVLEICDNAFFGSSIERIAIGKDVRIIGSGAFSKMSAIISIEVDSNNKYFSSLTGILYDKEMTSMIQIPTHVVNITIPGSVSELASNTFLGMENLETVYIEYGVKKIGSGCFDNAKNLKSLTIPASVTTLGSNMIRNTAVTSIVIPGSITTIAADTFRNAALLETVILSEGVSVINSGAFCDCVSLRYMHFPSTLTSIAGTNTFKNTPLVSWEFPDSVKLGSATTINTADHSAAKYVEFGEFKTNQPATLGTTNVEHVTLTKSAAWNNTLKTLIKNWTNVKYFTVESNNTTLSSSDGVLFNKGMDTLLSYPAGKNDTTYTIPDGIITIGAGAFANALNLTTIYIPASVTTIEADAFSGCKSLENIVFLGSSVKSVGDNALLTDDGTDTTVYVGSEFNWNGQEPDYVTIESTHKVSFSVAGAVKETFVVYHSTEIRMSDYSKKYSSDVWSGNDGEIYLSTDFVTILTDIVFSVDDFGMDLDGNIISYLSSKTDVVIPDKIFGREVTGMGDNLFTGNTKITSIVLPDNLLSIPSNAFKNCSALEMVTIGSGTNSIGSTVFTYCNALTAILVDPDNESFSSVDGVLFDKERSIIFAYPAGKTVKSYTIPDTVKKIVTFGFYNCKLESIYMSDSVTAIETYAFYMCVNLKSVVLSDSLTTLSNYIFSGCTSLTSVNIPDSVTSIGTSAFRQTAITSIVIPDSVTSIGTYAFYQCTNLESIGLPNGITLLDSSLFYGCKSLKSIVIPNTVISIGASVFYQCSSITSIVIPDSVTSIGTSAFRQTSITSIVIPDSVTSIGTYAFEGCTKATSLSIGSGITEIAGYTFNNCSGLKYILIPSTVKSLIGNDALSQGMNIFFEGDSMPSLGSANTLRNSKVYCHSSSADFEWASNLPATNVKGAFWYATFIVDETEYKVPVAEGDLDLSLYPFTSGDNPVTEWTVGDKVYKSDDTLEINADVTLGARV